MSLILRQLAKFIPLLSLLIPIAAIGQTDAIQGHCTLGGTKALVSGLGSTNFQQGIIPGCTVSVYLTGTTTLATIYSNSTGTVLANPFTAVQAGSPNPGYWIFYAATGQGYDVKLSGGGGNPLCTTAPNCYTVPLTYTDLKVGSGGGGTGLTFFSSGNNPPLFNTTVTNPGTTPNLAFNPINQSAQTVFGNFTGASAQPFFAQYACTGLLACTYNSGSNTWTLNVPSTSTLSVTATSPILVNGGAGPVSSGTANISCPTCGAPQLQMAVTPPAAGNYVVLYPTTQSISGSAYCAGWNAANPTGYGVSFPNYSGLFTGGTCTNTLSNWADSNGNPWPLSYINPANVTAVYAVGISSWQPARADLGGFSSQSPALNCAGAASILNSTAIPTQVSSLSSLTGATIGSETCTAQIVTNSSIGQAFGGAYLETPVVALYVFSTDAPAQNPNFLNIGSYLEYDKPTNTLKTATFFPQYLNITTVSDLTVAPHGSGLAVVYDAQSTPGVCTGGGTTTATAVLIPGTGWYCTPGGSGGGGGGITALTGDVTATGPGSVPATLSNTGVTAGSYTSANITVDAKGRITAAANGSGGGSIGGSGTAGFYALWSASTTLGNGSLDDGISSAGFITSSKPVKVVCTTCATQVDLTYNGGHAPSGTAGSASIAPDTTGNLTINPNGTAYTPVPPLASGFISGHCGQPTSSGGVWTIADSGAACGTGGGGGSPSTPAGTIQVYKDSTHFGGSGTWVFEAGVNGAVCDGTTDDTSALNTLLSTVYTAGGGTIQVVGTCLISGQITLPNNADPTSPTQPAIRITATTGSASGKWETPIAPPASTGTLDMRFNATAGKILTLGLGKLEIDHLTLKDGGSDCAAFIYTTNTTIAVHDNLFTGTASGTSACNDALVLGGTSATPGSGTINAFRGYGSYIQHNFFDKIRRGVYLRTDANAVTVKDNTWSSTCGSTNTAAAVQLTTSAAQTSGNIFSGNLYETANYPYVIWLDGATTQNNMFTGEDFWDATATTLFLFHFTNSAAYNLAYIVADGSIPESKVSDDNHPFTGTNFVMDQSVQTGIGIAAHQERICTFVSGSGTAQVCNTGVTFPPATGTIILFNTATANTGSGFTLNANSLGAVSVAKYSAGVKTTTLSAGDILSGLNPMWYDGTNWVLYTPGASAAGISLTTTGTSGAATLSGGTLNIPQYQGALTLTTTGSSGAASLVGNTLNIPQYSGSTGGAWTNISGSVTPTGATCTSGSCSFTTASAVTFASIPGTGNHLDVKCSLKASTVVGLDMTFNGDTASTSYAYQGQEIQNTASVILGQVSKTFIYAGAVGSVGGQLAIEVPYYATTSIARVANVTAGGFASQSANTNNFADTVQGLWNNTSNAITSVTITPSTGTITGSCSIYLVN